VVVEIADVADAGEVGGLGNGGHAIGETLAGAKQEASLLEVRCSKTRVARERRDGTRKEVKIIVPTEHTENTETRR
jgi:hypothetical protein